MEKNIIFSPILKYILIFIISFMYLNNLNISTSKILHILVFIILISFVLDIFMFDNYLNIITEKKLYILHDDNEHLTTNIKKSHKEKDIAFDDDTSTTITSITSESKKTNTDTTLTTDIDSMTTTDITI